MHVTMDCSAVAMVVLFSAVAVVHSETPRVDGPELRYVEQHTPIILECQVSTVARSVKWYRDDVQVVANSNKITFSVGESAAAELRKSVLTIAEAEQADSGAYKCEADGIMSDNSAAVNVTASHHSLTAISSEVTLIRGSKLTLSCQGDIHTHIVWYKGKNLINSSDGVTVTTTDDDAKHIRTSTLTVKLATAADEGEYSCRDEHHEDERSVITVKSSAVSGQTCSGCSTVALLVGLVISFRLLL